MEDDRPLHSPIGASSMHRWKACPGSIKLSEGLPNTSGVAAQEGTAAHEIVALALERGFSENRPAFEVLREHIEALRTYTEYIESLKKENPIHIEHSFDMSDIFDNLYGTADCVIYDQDSKILHVIDYKHGKGIPVEVENNSQLSYYALGVLHTLAYPCRFVQMTIVQPRCFHPQGKIRSWRVSVLHFIEFELDLIKAAKATKKKKAPLVAGSHCIFCPAKTICKEHHNMKVNQAKEEFKQRPFQFYNDPKKDFEPIVNEESQNNNILKKENWFD